MREIAFTAFENGVYPQLSSRLTIYDHRATAQHDSDLSAEPQAEDPLPTKGKDKNV